MSTGGAKRKAPMSVSAGILSSEQAGQQGGAPSTTKRTRFDVQSAADEDAAGDLDIQEQDRKRNQQGRKGRVVTDGYDSEEEDEVIGIGSDSDEEEERRGQDDESNGNGKIVGVDEDDDMFNLDDDDERPKAPNKGKKYLRENDIEGQELSEYDSDGENDAEFQLESDEEEEEEEEEKEGDSKGLADPDAVVRPLGKKKRRKTLNRKSKDGLDRQDSPDMGFQMERFNMKNEMATGRFDEEGNYVANARDPHAEHDKWLTGQYNRKTISKARMAQQQREKQLKEQEASRPTAKLDEDECKMRLAGLLRRNESVLEALQRLGNEVKKAKKERKQSETSTTVQSESDLDQLTSVCSELMSRYGRVNIYDVTYEELLRDVRRSGLVRETWDPAAAYEPERRTETEKKYTYRWSPAYLATTTGHAANDEQEQFGPFTGDELKAWQAAGYFGDGGERIVLRAGDAEKDERWKGWSEVFE